MTTFEFAKASVYLLEYFLKVENSKVAISSILRHSKHR